MTPTSADDRTVDVVITSAKEVLFWPALVDFVRLVAGLCKNHWVDFHFQFVGALVGACANEEPVQFWGRSDEHSEKKRFVL